MSHHHVSDRGLGCAKGRGTERVSTRRKGHAVSTHRRGEEGEHRVWKEGGTRVPVLRFAAGNKQSKARAKNTEESPRSPPPTMITAPTGANQSCMQHTVAFKPACQTDKTRAQKENTKQNCSHACAKGRRLLKTAPASTTPAVHTPAQHRVNPHPKTHLLTSLSPFHARRVRRAVERRVCSRRSRHRPATHNHNKRVGAYRNRSEAAKNYGSDDEQRGGGREGGAGSKVELQSHVSLRLCSPVGVEVVRRTCAPFRVVQNSAQSN